MPRSRTSCATVTAGLSYRSPRIHQDVIARGLTAAPLVDPVPVRRLVLSFAMDRPTTGLARFAGKAIIDIVTDQVERAVWVGQLLDSKAGHP